jgi:hypothetical protein
MLHLTDVLIAAAQHVGPVPQLPWYARCLGDCLNLWYGCLALFCA